MSTTKYHAHEKDNRGQGMVEFALVLPILLLLMLGIFEFGRLMLVYSSVSSASREAARYGSSIGEIGADTPNYLDCESIYERARRLGGIAGIQDENIIVQYDHGPETDLIGDCTNPPSHVTLGDRIIVEVTANYEPIVPFVNVPPMPITSVTSRMIVKDVSVGVVSVADAKVRAAATATAAAEAPEEGDGEDDGGDDGGDDFFGPDSFGDDYFTSFGMDDDGGDDDGPCGCQPQPTATPTPIPPEPPIFVKFDWTDLDGEGGYDCQMNAVIWFANPNWSEAPAQYQVVHDGQSHIIDPQYPIWVDLSETKLVNGGVTYYTIYGIFPGMQASQPLTAVFQCDTN